MILRYLLLILLIVAPLAQGAIVVNEFRAFSFMPVDNFDATDQEEPLRPELVLWGKHRRSPLSWHYELNTGMAEGSAPTHWALRQAYAGLDRHPLQLALGRRLVSWETFEFYSPIKYMVPFNLQRQAIDTNEQKAGVDFAGSYAQITDRLDLSYLYLPYIEPTRFPDSFLDPLRQVPSLQSVEYPSRERDSQSLLRLRYRTLSVTGAIIGFHGHDTIPVFRPGDHQWRSDLPEKKLIGGQFSMEAAGMIWKTELAYSDIEADCGRRPVCGSDVIQNGLLGVESQLPDDGYLILEGWYRKKQYQARDDALILLDSSFRNQRENEQSVLFAEYQKNAMNNQLKIRIAGGSAITSSGWFSRLKLQYSHNQHFTMSAKVTLNQGSNDSFFGFLEYSNGIGLQLSYFL
ncbi:MAG: hypothetical protein R3296_11415 [Oleiphilaceae bacterium]|nr:hypothetical protein [Oleiphilaceae bacterium]